MAGIPMSALRRALAEMSERAPSMGLGSHVYGAIESGARGSAVGATLGAGGGLLANMPDVDSGETTSQYGERLLSGIGTGAAIGAGLGPATLAIAGGRGLRWGLREALAEAAAERGIGRAAAREMSHVDDAARFAEASRGPMGGAQSAEDIARQIREMSQGQPSGTVEAMVRQVGEQDPQLGRQVMEILMGQSPY